MPGTGDPLSTSAAEGAGSVSVLVSPQRVRMTMCGQVDASMNAELAEAVRVAKGHASPVEVDTRAVTFMDSTVIALIAHLANRHPHPVQFINPPDLVRFLLEVTHIEEIVEILEADGSVAVDARGTAPDAPTRSA
ncbi:STAS domain-containing protein [Georgenia wangjunii]|uniref:STAS domain-containing protein n=1 Tax=Georgenia wangjunii TaxID=3117730 RepID=UPI002F2616E8